MKRSKPDGLRDGLQPGLYLVATPIGNLRDITLRALDVLAAADVVACEDSRVTRKLLNAHAIEAKLTAYHDHNAAAVRPRLLNALAEGGRVALVSDAGTPLISDPGYKLVRAAQDQGTAVIPVPGPSSVTAAIAAAGLPSDRFLFAGFLPAKATARRKELAALGAAPATLVLFESAKRLPASLRAMAEVLGDREAVVARELTKLHEELRRAPLSRLAGHYGGAGAAKGEAVILVAPPGDESGAVSEDVLDRRLRDALETQSLRDAVRAVTAGTGLPRRRVYRRALEMTASEDAGEVP